MAIKQPCLSGVLCVVRHGCKNAHQKGNETLVQNVLIMCKIGVTSLILVMCSYLDLNKNTINFLELIFNLGRGRGYYQPKMWTYMWFNKLTSF